MSKLVRWINSYASWVLLAFALVGVPLLQRGGFVSIETVNQLGRFLCFAIVALGIDLIWGYTGILSLCQAMFFCLGGYCIGMYMALHGPLDGDGIPRCLYVVSSDVSGFKLPWFWEPFRTLPVSLLLVLLVPGITAFIFGFFAFRSRVTGVYFSIITQATTLGLCQIFQLNDMRLCGTNGLTNFVTLAGYDVRTPETRLALYLITVVVLVGVYLLCRHLVNSRLGRILIAIRDKESRLRFSGYRPLYFKLFVFTVAAMIAGIGGMLYAPQTGIITPFNMDFDKSIFLVVLVAVGGRASLSGAILGALVVNFASSILTSGQIYNFLFTAKPADEKGFVQKIAELILGAGGWPFVLGALYIGVVLFFPDGLIGIWRRFVPATPPRSNAPSPRQAPVGAFALPSEMKEAPHVQH